MKTSGVIIGITIAVLYPYFFNKLVSTIYSKSEVDEMCKNFDCFQFCNGYKCPFPGEKDFNQEMYDKYQKCTEDSRKCREEQQKKYAEIDNKKFYYLIFAGIAGLAVGYNMKDEYLQFGLSLGGFISIMFAIYTNWGNLEEMQKLVLTGVSLVSLIFILVSARVPIFLTYIDKIFNRS